MKKRNMGNRVIAVTFLFSLLIFLLSCDNNFDMSQGVAAGAGYGKVAVTINGSSARTVFPTMAFAKYEYFFSRVTNGTIGTPEKQEPVGGFFTLELGDWQVTVWAYAEADDTGPSAVGTSETFTVATDRVAKAEVKLDGNAESGEGNFSYHIVYPAGAAINVFSLENLNDDNAPVITISGGGETSLEGTRANVPAGYYFLTIQLTESGETGKTTGVNEVVYIYDKLKSEYRKDFTEDDFSHVHDWSSWATTVPPTCTESGIDTRTCAHNAEHTDVRIGADALGHDWDINAFTLVAATETTDGIKAIACRHDPSHVREMAREYATGTAGLDFDLISINDGTNNAYRVHNTDTSNGTATGAIFIPAYHRPNTYSAYLPVTQISNSTNSSSSSAFGATSSGAPNTSITSITIPASVTSIDGNAFRYCESLTSIEIPNSVTYINYRTFQGCTSLASVTIGAGVKSIGDYAFENCTSLTSITIPASVTSIGTYAFHYCTSLTSITIPASVTSIGTYAFQDCSSLTSIEIPNSVTAINRYAFSRCTRLASVTIGAGVKSIGDYAFENCTSLASVTFRGTIPRSDFSNTAFYNVSSVNNLVYEFYATNSANGTPGRYHNSNSSSGWVRQP